MERITCLSGFHYHSARRTLRQKKKIKINRKARGIKMAQKEPSPVKWGMPKINW